MEIEYKKTGLKITYRGYVIEEVKNITAERMEYNATSETLFVTFFSVEEAKAEIDSIEDDTW